MQRSIATFAREIGAKGHVVSETFGFVAGLAFGFRPKVDVVVESIDVEIVYVRNDAIREHQLLSLAHCRLLLDGPRFGLTVPHPVLETVRGCVHQVALLATHSHGLPCVCSDWISFHLLAIIAENSVILVQSLLHLHDEQVVIVVPELVLAFDGGRVLHRLRLVLLSLSLGRRHATYIARIEGFVSPHLRTLERG